MGMRGAGHGEGEDRPLARRIALDIEPVEPPQPRAGVIAKIALMGGDVLHAKARHVIERHAKADHLHDPRRAGLEPERRIGVGDALAGDLADHVAPAEEGAHLRHPLGARIKRARAGGAIELVAGDGVEIAADIGHVHRHVHRRLRAVQKHRHPGGARALAHSLHIHHRAEHV